MLQEDGQDMRETMTLIRSIQHAAPWLRFEEEDPADMIVQLFPMIMYDLWLSQRAEVIHDCEQVLIRYINAVTGEDLKRD
jgi:hypothetical protein